MKKEPTQIRKKKLHNLSTQWMLIMSAVILPLNLLILYIANTAYQSFEARIVQTLEQELSLYVDNLNAQINGTRDSVSQMLEEDNRLLLTIGVSKDSTVDMIHLKNKVRQSMSWSTIQGLYYIKDEVKGIISVNGGNYSALVKNEVQNLIQEKESDEKNRIYHSDCVLVLQGGDPYLCENYHFQRFSFGFLVDGRQLVEAYPDAGKWNGVLLLSSKEGKILSCTNNLFNDEQLNAILNDCQNKRKGSFSQFISWPLPGRDAYIAFSFPLNFMEEEIIWILNKKDVMTTLPVLIRFLYALVLLSFIALPLLCMVTIRLFLRPLKKMHMGMEEVEKGNLSYQLPDETGSNEMEYLFSSFNHMTGRLQSLVQESYRKEMDKVVTEAINIRLQVNQHMLLNFLNTIYSLSIAGRQKEAGEFTLLLMKYFRYVLRKNMTLTSVREEIAFLEDYIKLQKVRYPESFSYIYSCDEEAMNCMIPQLLIENFVENAIKYGQVMGQVTEIIVTVRRHEERLFITVSDTGTGITEDMLKLLNAGETVTDETGTHIGIWNCRRRLNLYYAGDFVMHITSKPGEGTQVYLEMPDHPLDMETAAIRMESI